MRLFTELGSCLRVVGVLSALALGCKSSLVREPAVAVGDVSSSNGKDVTARSSLATNTSFHLLKGVWRADTIQNNSLRGMGWFSFTSCELRVYSSGSTNFGVQYPCAQFVASYKPGAWELVHDSLPVMLTTTQICFGPLNSPLVFDYSHAGEELNLALVRLSPRDTEPPIMIRLRRTSLAPPPPILPDLMKLSCDACDELDW